MAHTYSDESDESLVSRAVEGDTLAFTALVNRYELRLFNYIRRIVGNATDAEDLFQDVFVKVHTKLHRFEQGRPFRPWLYRIATNQCRDHLRYRKLRRALSLDFTGDDGGVTLADSLAAPNPSPRESAVEQETNARLTAAIAALPLKHRTVFIMARYENLPYDEIARTLEIPVGTVKSRMNKAVSVLMDALEGDNR